jgi:hypothetical protein
MTRLAGWHWRVVFLFLGSLQKGFQGLKLLRSYTRMPLEDVRAVSGELGQSEFNRLLVLRFISLSMRTSGDAFLMYLHWIERTLDCIMYYLIEYGGKPRSTQENERIYSSNSNLERTIDRQTDRPSIMNHTVYTSPVHFPQAAVLSLVSRVPLLARLQATTFLACSGASASRSQKPWPACRYSSLE